MFLFFEPASDFPVAHGAAEVVGGVAGPRAWLKQSTSNSKANFSCCSFTSSSFRRREMEQDARVSEIAATVERHNPPVEI